jgi:hypothetical protein
VTQWFLNDDAGYLAWLAAHDDGFVLNTYAHVAAGYLVVHRARCRTINRDLAVGKVWTVQYGKACADSVDELLAWAAERTSGIAHGCGLCQPGVPESPLKPRAADHRPGGSRAVHQAALALKLVGDPIAVTIRRLDAGPPLVIDGAQWVAETFFRVDRSAVGPKSYDARVQSGPKDRFELADLRAVNGSMATRMVLVLAGPFIWSFVEPLGLSSLRRTDAPFTLVGKRRDGVPWICGMHPGGAQRRGWPRGATPS